MSRHLAIVVAVLSAVLPATVYAQTPAPLDEAGLRALIPGSTMSAINSRGQNFRETYREDGRLTATSTRTDGSCCIADGGKWEIEAGQFCRQYDNWGDRRRFCHPIGRPGHGSANLSNGSSMAFERP